MNSDEDLWALFPEDEILPSEAETRTSKTAGAEDTSETADSNTGPNDKDEEDDLWEHMDTLSDVEITATGEIVTHPVVPSDAASPNITGDEQEEEAVAVSEASQSGESTAELGTTGAALSHLSSMCEAELQSYLATRFTENAEKWFQFGRDHNKTIQEIQQLDEYAEDLAKVLEVQKLISCASKSRLFGEYQEKRARERAKGRPLSNIKPNARKTATRKKKENILPKQSNAEASSSKRRLDDHNDAKSKRSKHDGPSKPLAGSRHHPMIIISSDEE